MSAMTLTAVKSEGFSIGVAEEANGILLKCSGNAGMDAMPILNNYLKQLHAEACQLGVGEVVVDFRDMYFMNSSCFKCFASWLSTVVKMPKERYRVRFLSNSQLHWQRRSLEALRCLAPEIVQVTSDAP